MYDDLAAMARDVRLLIVATGPQHVHKIGSVLVSESFASSSAEKENMLRRLRDNGRRDALVRVSVRAYPSPGRAPTASKDVRARGERYEQAPAIPVVSGASSLPLVRSEGRVSRIPPYPVCWASREGYLELFKELRM